jgi:hypothetical protein
MINNGVMKKICWIKDKKKYAYFYGQEKQESTYAFLTSSIFKGPVRGRPRIVLSEWDPTEYDALPDSVSRLASHSLYLWSFHFGGSLHSNPDGSPWKDLLDHVYHLFPNVAWKTVSGSPEYCAELSLLSLPDHFMKSGVHPFVRSEEVTLYYG